MSAGIAMISSQEEEAECAFTDRNLDEVMTKINNGLEDVGQRHPNIKQVKITSGLRGVRYFIEFPIVTRKFDALALNESVKKMISDGKTNF